MSYDRDEAVKTFKEIFKNGRITNELLINLENQLQQREQKNRIFYNQINTDHYQKLMKTILILKYL